MDLPTGESPIGDKIGMLTARTEPPNLPRVPNDRGVPYTSEADDKENNVTAKTEAKVRTPGVGLVRDSPQL